MVIINGSFVVMFENRVECHLLSGPDMQAYYERVRIADFDKATKFTWGHDAVNAFPCTLECMEFIALNFPDGSRVEKQLKALCARIALGQPLNDSGHWDGGLGIPADHAKPKAPSGGDGAMVEAQVFQSVNQ